MRTVRVRASGALVETSHRGEAQIEQDVFLKGPRALLFGDGDNDGAAEAAPLEKGGSMEDLLHSLQRKEKESDRTSSSLRASRRQAVREEVRRKRSGVKAAFREMPFSLKQQLDQADVVAPPAQRGRPIDPRRA